MGLQRLVDERGWRWEWRTGRTGRFWVVVSPRGVVWRLRLSGGAALQRME